MLIMSDISTQIPTQTPLASQKIHISILMGSSSDWPIMKCAADILMQFNIFFEKKVISAHRMPNEMFEYAEQAYARGIRAIIAGAGGAAHLPGMLAAKTIVPVFGVPIPSKYLSGQDSLYSIVQMPKAIPVATFAIGEAGAANAALHALANLAMYDEALYTQLQIFREQHRQIACAMSKDLLM
jgi:5-(carboxyamino)imidazole ribonucleotide mutase